MDDGLAVEAAEQGVPHAVLGVCAADDILLVGMPLVSGACLLVCLLVRSAGQARTSRAAAATRALEMGECIGRNKLVACGQRLLRSERFLALGRRVEHLDDRTAACLPVEEWVHVQGVWVCGQAIARAHDGALVNLEAPQLLPVAVVAAMVALAAACEGHGDESHIHRLLDEAMLW